MKKEEKKEEKKYISKKSPKEMRLEIAAQKEKAKKEPKNIEAEFKRFFIKISRQKNLDLSLEEVLWAHFKSAGFDRVEKFNEGLKHFGL